MGVRIVRKPSANYIVRSGANYYAEDDVNLENSLGTTDQDYYASLVNILWGKIHIDNTPYLVAIDDMEIQGRIEDYNTISSVDDIIGLRYAYGNQNGYAIGIGSELSASYENGTFTVNSGRAVIQGDEVDFDANGLSTTLDTGLETRYFKIYLKTNIDSNVAELESYYSTVSYDDIPEPASGEVIGGNTAYLLLYTLKLNGAVEAEKNKIIRQIDYSNRRLLWQGNAEIGTTNPQSEINSFATIPAKENTTYEIQGEIAYSGTGGYTKETFVIHLQVGLPNEHGYKTEQIVGTWMTDELLQFKKIEISRWSDYFYGRALMPTLYFENHHISYNDISAKITKIYEIN